MTSTPAGPLPGEDAPLAMRPGGAPITPEEALGVARRVARVARAHGRLVRLDAVDELPPEDATLVPAAYRLPPRLLHAMRAKAEIDRKSTRLNSSLVKTSCAVLSFKTLNYTNTVQNTSLRF